MVKVHLIIGVPAWPSSGKEEFREAVSRALQAAVLVENDYEKILSRVKSSVIDWYKSQWSSIISSLNSKLQAAYSMKYYSEGKKEVGDLLSKLIDDITSELRKDYEECVSKRKQLLEEELEATVLNVVLKYKDELVKAGVVSERNVTYFARQIASKIEYYDAPVIYVTVVHNVDVKDFYDAEEFAKKITGEKSVYVYMINAFEKIVDPPVSASSGSDGWFGLKGGKIERKKRKRRRFSCYSCPENT